MHYQKAVLFGDEVVAQQILEAASPGVVKRLGRQVSGFDAEKWDQHKNAIVVRGNYHKFTGGSTENLPHLPAETLKDALLDTQRATLLEARKDFIWGIGFTPATAAENRAKWGSNKLGKALVQVRRILWLEEYKEVLGLKFNAADALDDEDLIDIAELDLKVSGKLID
jgi:ribA/ribD-fused uncharacterized protein